MSSLFVGDEDGEEYTLHDRDDSIILENPIESEKEIKDDSNLEPSIPINYEDSNTTIYQTREICCSLPLRFHQEIVEDMLSKDGLLILGRGLGWELVTANLLHALSAPTVILQSNGKEKKTKKSLLILLNSREEEIFKLSEDLTELRWIDKRNEDTNESGFDHPPLITIGGDSMTVDKRKRVYENGGIVSVTSRILVVDLLSGVVQPNDITGLFILHAEKVKETSNESFIINLYRDVNDWGFVKAVSDEPESFTGFTPLATKLKVLRLSNVFLWPRFHVEVSSSLNFRGKNLPNRQKQELERRRFVTEINTKLSYKMNKIQSAILSCIQACLLELKRHNPLLVTEYWDMENIHDSDFVPRIRLSLDSQWHRISWTSKQLVYDLTTLKDLLKYLLILDSLSFYQVVQEIIDLNIKTTGNDSMNVASMSPWLNLDEANTIISYAKERALGKIIVSKSRITIGDENEEEGGNEMAENTQESEIQTEEYNLEELPKWDQLGILLDDIMYEKSQNTANHGPIVIMCSDSKTAKQLSYLISNMKDITNTDSRRKRFSGRKFMVNKLNDYLEWKEFTSLTRKLNSELDMKKQEEISEVNEPERAATPEEELQTSKTFSRGKGHPLSKRRRTRGASAVANVGRLYSGSNKGRTNEAVELDAAIVNKLKEEINEKQLDENPGSGNNSDDNAGGFLVDEDQGQVVDIQDVDYFNEVCEYRTSEIIFENIDKDDQIIIETYNDKTNDSLLQEVSPAYIIMYEPNLSFIRRVEIYQAVNKEYPAKTYFMYYGTSVEEQKHLMRIKKEKDAFTKLIREKATLGKHFESAQDNNKFQLNRNKVVNTRIAGGARFRMEEDEMRVVVDVREFRSSLPNLLYRVGIKVVPCMITVGDYIVSPKICIERKAIPDLISSFKSGRLYSQCEQMFRHYELPTLLIEFDESKSFSFEPFSDLRNYKVNATNPIATKLQQQDIQSKLIMLLISFPKLKIIWSSSPYETAQIFLELKANQEEPDISAAVAKGVNQSIKISSGEPPLYNDNAIDLIQNIPGINNINYYKVIEKVQSIEELVKLSEDEFTDLIGIENGKKAYKFIHRSVK
ncbi:uncharacterized protein AC631_02589 [Debaryomyces fabryi]|uniref:ERCC4 domain-containing protein n=1 Tax=Debaryomyces fabryi TaxID=58627 RepID=A0A0V1PZH5_9ASCO|nr:uncharacterized protein AC631_02589 [Debaryomyces fabryi]KSA01649.1 hypothetical protein AC631_02589 [Debaryomyces fabryi]CUM45412.1 unnamed protein product [Debaryomyces fabryi]